VEETFYQNKKKLEIQLKKTQQEDFYHEARTTNPTDYNSSRNNNEKKKRAKAESKKINSENEIVYMYKIRK
jgi:hypothetical protein